MYYKTFYKSPLGNMTLVSDGKNLVGLWILGQKYFESTLSERVQEKEDLDIFRQT
ncbi:MAG: hypothetical protein J6J74_05990, partial [Elusimicrobiaceae bacterium]|nr:hypothetical protein [Elusimicrobiaceae bacterium]